MLFSASKTRTNLVATSAAFAIATYAMPLVIPWYVIFIVGTGIACIPLFQSTTLRITWGAIAFTLIVLVLSVKLSPTIVATALAVGATAIFAPAIALALCIVNLSIFETLQEILAARLYQFGLEGTSPAIISIAVLAFIFPKQWRAAGLFVLTTLTAGLLAHYIGQQPETAIAIPSSVACTFYAWIAIQRGKAAVPFSYAAAAMIILGIGSWAGTLPRTTTSVYLLLPKSNNSADQKHFENYPSALHFAGIKVSLAESLKDIPVEATLLLPWMTASFSGGLNDDISAKLGDYARAGRWTVIVAGEHTNLGGVAARVETFSGKSLLRSDLTVPRNNTDDSGPLRSASIRPWLHGAILNRGASVTAFSYKERILLSGDGWWAEPDIKEWLWVGDYKWSRSDRAGRLALAVSSDDRGARWIVVGDNSLFISRQIYADPRPLRHILEMSSLWPSLFKDCFLLALCILVAVSSALPTLSTNAAASFVSLLLCIASLVFLKPIASHQWADYYVSESGFDPRNFNARLAENPDFLQRGRLLRNHFALQGSITLPKENTMFFTLIDGEAVIDGVRVNSCRRLGSLKSNEGPYLRDAQACRIEGNTVPVIGTMDAAAAFLIKGGTHDKLVVLDTAFLSYDAPPENISWLIRETDGWMK